MARAVSKNVNFQVHDDGAVLRTIPINSIDAVGLTYEEHDLTAYQDAVKGALPGHPDAPIEIGGPFSDDAAAAAGTLSGSHTILKDIVGGTTPLTLDVQFGMGGAAWSAGDPQFGISASASDGYLCVSYVVNPDGTYSARFVLAPGSAAPAWGTTAES